MKAEERTIGKILTEQICYEIPPYQRPYSWKSDNVQQLLEDIWEAYQADDREYFIGSLITIEKERDRRYDVVDGQQRLTTLSLIFARLRDRISDPAAKAELGKRILPKLFANYLLTKVYVVFVNTDSWKSAHRLFNVLNARGLSLSNADLIKNSLFSLLGTQASQSEELEDRWLELEETVGIERLEAFFSHYRTSVLAVRAQESLYEEIEPLIRDTSGGPFSFLDEVIRAAQNYLRIIEADFVDRQTVRALRALHRVEYDDWIPPLLAYLNRPVSGIFEAGYVSLLEKITMQNWVRRLGRTARMTVYSQLISAIRDGNSGAAIRQIFKNNAQNAEFLSLLGGELYGKPFDAAVLLRLEEASQDDSVTKSYNGRLTIEHVLPQALKDSYWKERFTSDQHRLWLHRLGNLTILSGYKNYKAQYYAFDHKKSIYNGRNKRVSFDLTKEVCEAEDWTVDIIKNRHERLLNLAAQTWVIE